MTAIKAKRNQDFDVASKGLVTRLGYLAVIVSVVAVVAALTGTLLFDADIKTAAIAWLVCLVSALAAHASSEYPKGNEFIQARMAIQMLLRTGLPMLVAIWGIYFALPPLEKSLVFYMILFYLVGLVVDVQLNISRLNAESRVDC